VKEKSIFYYKKKKKKSNDDFIPQATAFEFLEINNITNVLVSYMGKGKMRKLLRMIFFGRVILVFVYVLGERALLSVLGFVVLLN
jgi:hypothetical protein